MKSEKFMHYMMCGHGRCFSALESNKEKFREIVLYGCLNDITFDLQCEGSRGLFMYNLALQYDDFHYFLDSAIEKFLSPSVDCDWHLISHLCDFISLFADDYGDKSAEKALSEKYAQIYGHLMSVRWSAMANEILQCYEYISIVMAQKGDISRTLGIIEDMGKFFIRRRRADDNDLKCDFHWFWHCACEEYGSEILEKNLDILCGKSAGARRFRRVMNCPENKSSSAEDRKISAEDFIERAENSVKRRDVILMRLQERDEKMKVAQAVVEEKDLNKKSELLKAFTISGSEFPLSPEILIKYALSENKNLRTVAIDALSYIKADCVRDFAVKQLEKSFSSEILEILIKNYTEKDKDILLDCLKKLTIDRDNNSGWHGIVMAITNDDTIEVMPDEAIIFVYENSMCSFCREGAVSEMIRRNIFNETFRDECLMDCNSDIRTLAENFNI